MIQYSLYLFTITFCTNTKYVSIDLKYENNYLYINKVYFVLLFIKLCIMFLLFTYLKKCMTSHNTTVMIFVAKDIVDR